MIPEAEVEKALMWLAEKAEDIANARAQAVYTADMIDHIEGVLMREKYASEPVTVRKNIARSDERFLQALKDKRDAAHAHALMQANRERATMTIEVYRTQSANQRTAS